MILDGALKAKHHYQSREAIEIPLKLVGNLPKRRFHTVNDCTRSARPWLYSEYGRMLRLHQDSNYNYSGVVVTVP